MVPEPSLLITDDDRFLRETLGAVLGRRGYRTHLAADGEEAIEIIRNERVHLALFDLHMPRLNGLSTVRQLDRLRSLVPWILISGSLDERVIAEARALHALSILSKPIDNAKVTNAVRAAMRASYKWFEDVV